MNTRKDLKTKSRIEYMDIAKGIAILAVVAGHVYMPPPSLVGRVLYSFHMPLFFIINGFFIKDFNIKKNVINSCKRLLLPYVIGTVFEMIAVICLEGGMKGIEEVRTLFCDMIGGFCKDPVSFPMFHGTWMLWFLPSLFLARIIFVVIIKTTEKSKYNWSIRIITIAFLSFLGMLSPILKNEYFPWGIEISLVSLPFLFSGFILYQYKFLANKHRYIISGICLILWVVLLISGFYIDMAAHYWPGFYLAIIEGIIASFFVLCFSQLINKVAVLKSVLLWVGKHSLIMLLAHNIEMRYIHVESLFGEYINNNLILVVAVKIIFVLSVAGICAVVSFLWHKKQARLIS